MPPVRDRPDHPGVVVPRVRREEHEGAAGDEHAVHLGEDKPRMVEVLENPCCGDDVERACGEGQLLTGSPPRRREHAVLGERVGIRIDAEHRSRPVRTRDRRRADRFARNRGRGFAAPGDETALDHRPIQAHAVDPGGVATLILLAGANLPLEACCHAGGSVIGGRAAGRAATVAAMERTAVRAMIARTAGNGSIAAPAASSARAMGSFDIRTQDCIDFLRGLPANRWT